MFADEIRRAIEASPRVKLPAVTALMWRAFGAGQVTEAEAEALSSLIEARQVVPVAAGSPRKPVGSRPRTDASMERRRRWAASGRLSPTLAARFTTAEQAVLAVVAVEVVKKGSCQLTVGHLAALAGVSQSTARNALREARRQQILTIEERRISAWRNDSNIVRVVSAEWLSWLRLTRKEGGCNSVMRTNTTSSRPASKRLSEALKSCRRAEADASRERSGKHPRTSSGSKGLEPSRNTTGAPSAR